MRELNKLIVAWIVFLFLVILFLWQCHFPIFYTGWVLFVFMLYLGAYIMDFSHPRLESTMLTLTITILFMFIVVVAIDALTNKTIWTYITQHPWVMVGLLVLHLIPVCTLLYLNGPPLLMPYQIITVGFFVLYVLYVYLSTKHGLAVQYGLPHKWWANLVFPLVAILSLAAMDRLVKLNQKELVADIAEGEVTTPSLEEKQAALAYETGTWNELKLQAAANPLLI
ncbi:Hypothetical protein POVN_LOCUS153 [uncultured virus]|nr:Hypothetical protein POVN_LOCUS153 [uncultured virus]